MWALSRGIVLETTRRDAEAIAHFEETLRVHPGLTPALLHLGLAQVNTGKPEDAVAIFDRALAIRRDPSYQLLALKGYALARAGRREEALAIVREIEKAGEHQPVPSHNSLL